MNCEHPNCRSAAVWVPVIALPTIRDSSSGTPVETKDPTLLLMPSVCQRHKQEYNLTYWIPESEWHKIRDAARGRGFIIPDTKLIGVQFRPIGYEPSMKWMELNRHGEESDSDSNNGASIDPRPDEGPY